MEFLDQIWKFVKGNPAAAGVILTAVLAAIAGAWKFYRYLSAKPKTDRPGQRIEEGDKNIQIGQARDISISKGADVDVNVIVERLEERARREGVLSVQLQDANQRAEDLRGQVRQLTEAVEALKAEGTKPDAPPEIDQALRLLSEGETEAAEAVFEEVKARRKAEGEGALKEAAAAARHIGALAYLHDTGKAVAAYREAVDLDPDDPDGWNQLGHLLDRTGDLDGAAEAYKRVLSFGNRAADQAIIAAATGNLGTLYQVQGELDHAEEMYRKALNLNEALGRKEGMALGYGNLGSLYMSRKEFGSAEEMYRKSLGIEEALGHKEGMASDYGNLGILYTTRGEFDRAEVTITLGDGITHSAATRWQL